jgi:[ribosomal protein S18]-alanine N-acetyltransferase
MATQIKNQASHIRWMIRRDMGEVLSIEQRSFEYAWSEEEFIRCLRRRDVIGMVAEKNEKVVGFMIYELHKDRIDLLNFCVSPSCLRMGIGTELMDRLKSKLSHERRNRIVLQVREVNIPAQLFFSSLGFIAIAIMREFYKETNEDAYLMQYRHDWSEDENRDQ